jgi:MipA family protein
MQQLFSQSLSTALSRRFVGVIVSSIALMTALASPAAQAQTDEASWHLGVALGHGKRTNPLIGGDDIDINYVLDFSWYGEQWFFDNGDLGYTFLNEGNFSINGIITYNNERNYYNYLTGKQFGLDSLLGPNTSLTGTKDQINPQDNIVKLTGTESLLPGGTVAYYLNENTEIAGRRSAINGGLEFLYISPYGDVQAQVLTDISSTHEGQEAWLSWSHPWYTRRSEVTLTLGLEWKSTDLIGYYFGVKPEESFIARPTYQGDSGTNAFVRLAGRYSLSEHWTLVGMIELEQLSSAITQSPIVNTAIVDTFFAGLFYAF